MEISAQLYTVREFTQNEEGIAKTLKKIKELGYNSVQVSGFGQYRVEFLRDELLKNELSVCATHTALDRILNDTDRVIKEHKMLSIPFVGLGYAKFNSLSAVKEFLENIKNAVDKIYDNGLKFLYHNHHFEFVLRDGVTPMQYMLEHTDAKKFGVLADTYWLQHAGVNPVKFIEQNADRIEVIHLKDMKIDEEFKPRFSVVCEGNMDIDGIIESAIKAKVKYSAVEQDDCYGEDPFDALGRSRKKVKERFGL